LKDFVSILLALGALAFAGTLFWMLIKHANSQYAEPQQNTRTVLISHHRVS
jgi:hypothetical protein